MSKTEELQLRESMQKYGLPEHMREAVIMYIVHHVQPGRFLTALMSNDLTEAFGRADEGNVKAMHNWVGWFYNEAPSLCWGSPARVQEWLAEAKAEVPHG